MNRTLSRGFLPLLEEESCAERQEVSEGMKVKVDPDVCTACELCTETCPEVFEMGDDVAKAKIGVIPAEAAECVRQAADDCPAEAIIIEE